MTNPIKRALRKAGYEIQRYAPDSSQVAQLMAILKYHGVNTVFDIGANVGNFGRFLRHSGYVGDIFSFEPMRAAYDALVVATRNDPLWHAAERTALGAEDGNIEINIAGNSESSSILDMLNSHRVAAPRSAYIGIERVPLHRLDTLAPEYLRDSSTLFIKIDTQGYEDQVLAGATSTISRAVVLQVELSLVELYAGQKLMPEILTMMKKFEFDLWGIAPVFVDAQSGQMYQGDGIFCRSAAARKKD